MSRCPACDGPSTLAFVARDWNRGAGAGEFPYHRCRRCGLFALDPAVADADEAYGREYFEMPATLAELQSRAAHERYKLTLLQRFKRQGKLLEVGPATGEFAYLAMTAGFRVTVVERDPDCCAFIQDVLGIEAVRSSDPAAALPSLGHFDAICMWQTIEHLPRCLSALDAAAAHLAPAGVLVISTPNPEAFQFKLLGRRWTHVDAPRHRFLLPAAIVADRARRSGLSPLLHTTTDEGSLGWNRFGWERSLSNLWRGRRGRELLGRVGRTVARILTPIERLGGRGSAYTIVLGRP